MNGIKFNINVLFRFEFRLEYWIELFRGLENKSSNWKRTQNAAIPMILFFFFFCFYSDKTETSWTIKCLLRHHKTNLIRRLRCSRESFVLLPDRRVQCSRQHLSPRDLLVFTSWSIISCDSSLLSSRLKTLYFPNLWC